MWFLRLLWGSKGFFDVSRAFRLAITRNLARASTVGTAPAPASEGPEREWIRSCHSRCTWLNSLSSMRWYEFVNYYPQIRRWTVIIVLVDDVFFFFWFVWWNHQKRTQELKRMGKRLKERLETIATWVVKICKAQFPNDRCMALGLSHSICVLHVFKLCFACFQYVLARNAAGNASRSRSQEAVVVRWRSGLRHVANSVSVWKRFAACNLDTSPMFPSHWFLFPKILIFFLFFSTWLGNIKNCQPGHRQTPIGSRYVPKLGCLKNLLTKLTPNGYNCDGWSYETQRFQTGHTHTHISEHIFHGLPPRCQQMRQTSDFKVWEAKRRIELLFFVCSSCFFLPYGGS